MWTVATTNKGNVEIADIHDGFIFLVITTKAGAEKAARRWTRASADWGFGRTYFAVPIPFSR